MSILTYGAVELQGIKTRRLEYTPVYDDSGLDLLFVRIQIEVDAIFNPGMTSYPVADSLPAETMNWVRQTLLTPRQVLYFNNGHDVINSPLPSMPLDPDWGPKPLFCNVQQISGQVTWIVSYGVETVINDCPTRFANMPILSNRYGQTWDIDSEMRTKILTVGKAVLAADQLAIAQANPHTLVTAIVPYVLPFFRRERISISLNPKGTEISYSVEDVETYYSLGTLADPNSVASRYGVTSFDIGYTQQSMQNQQFMAGLFMRITLAGVVYGHTFASTAQLVAFVLDLAQEKLYAQSLAVGIKVMMVDFNITASMNAPEVHFSMSVWCPAIPQGGVPFTITSVLFNQGTELVPDVGYSPNLGAIGIMSYEFPEYTAYLQSLHAACQGSCNLQIPYGSFSSLSACHGPVAYAYITTPIPKVFAAPNYNQPGRNLYSADNNDFFFGSYQVSANVKTNYHMLLAPTTQSTQELRPTATSYNAPLPWHSDQTFGNRNFSSVVSVGNPTAVLTYTWTAERAGIPPQVPHPKINSANVVLLESEVQSESPQLAPDGQTLMWRVSGEYTYALLKPLIAGDDMYSAINPYINLTFNETTIPGPNSSSGAQLNFILGGIIDDKNLDGGYVQNS